MALRASSNIVRLTLLCISSKAVIPAKAGIQLRNTGFRVKPGMTIKVKGLLTHYPSVLVFLLITGILMGGCSFAKTEQQDSFKEYRKKLEMQKAVLAKDEEKQITAPELGAEEYERIGNLYLAQGNMDLAFLQYDKALRADPSRIHIHYKLGRLFLEKGMPEEAGREFQEILKVTPNDALAHEGMGRVYFKQANFAEAEKSFQRAINLSNILWQAHNFLGIIYDRQGKFDLAISHYREAIALKPNSPMLYNNLGISLFLKRHYEEAVSAFKEALTLENSKKKIHNNLALALSKLERYEEAFEAFKKGGDEASAYYNLGNVYMRDGKVEEGMRVFEEAKTRGRIVP
jgi:Flp pilus assembly protein TadD